jgi:RNAse (barnase) inhibitor barstar
MEIENLSCEESSEIKKIDSITKNILQTTDIYSAQLGDLWDVLSKYLALIPKFPKYNNYICLSSENQGLRRIFEQISHHLRIGQDHKEFILKHGDGAVESSFMVYMIKDQLATVFELFGRKEATDIKGDLILTVSFSETNRTNELERKQKVKINSPQQLPRRSREACENDKRNISRMISTLEGIRDFLREKKVDYTLFSKNLTVFSNSEIKNETFNIFNNFFPADLTPSIVDLKIAYQKVDLEENK